MAGPRKDPEKAVEIGRRIAQARLEAGGMSQRELGELLGVSERSVAAYEAGDVVPYRFLKDLERVLGVQAGWLLHGENAISVSDRQYARILEELASLRSETEVIRALLEGKRDGRRSPASSSRS